MNLHHPYDDTLARLAAGRLGPGPSLVVKTHLSGCAECRARVGLFEAVGGALLEEAPAAPVRPEMFAAALRRIEEMVPEPLAAPRLVSPLELVDMPPWRSLGAALHWRRLKLPYAPEANIIMLKAARGVRIAEHAHRGAEYTQVLQGSYHDDFGRYSAGDCVEADDEIEHQPVVDSAVDCICLVAFEGKIRLKGWFGRLVQPLFGL